MKKSTIVALYIFGLAAIVLSGLIVFPKDDFKKDRMLFNGLLEVIGVADQMELTQHADMSNFESREGRKKEMPVYESRMYSRTEIQALLKDLSHLGSNEFELGALCFTPHHTMTFFAKSHQIGSVEICFECDRWALNKETMNPVQGSMEVFAAFVEEAGMDIDADWVKLARNSD